jgi:hypothetical protein
VGHAVAVVFVVFEISFPGRSSPGTVVYFIGVNIVFSSAVVAVVFDLMKKYVPMPAPMRIIKTKQIETILVNVIYICITKDFFCFTKPR